MLGLSLSTTDTLDWTQDAEYLAAALAVEIAASAAVDAEKEQLRLLRVLQPGDDGLFRTEPLSPRYQAAKEYANDLRLAAEEAERARALAEQAAKARALPLWLNELRDHFSLVAERVEQLAEAFGALEQFSDRANEARMQLGDLRIGSGLVNRDGLLHWLSCSRTEIDRQLVRKI